ncbi:hypothetical protein CRUP_013953 [Coryphaenoides rupestris]|nr:hypothetical protein CRUP_013953 [Coryphaenoides rupestris]
MPATEKDLAADAPWKKIQQNTFTRWCNEHLKAVNKPLLCDLQADLSDGLRLLALLEALSQRRMPRKHHPRPAFRQMKLENVSVALEFLEQENIKLVSIGEEPPPTPPTLSTLPEGGGSSGQGVSSTLREGGGDPLPRGTSTDRQTENSKAIVDGNLKLILGLIWTLILHYSISMPVWEDEEDEADKKTPKQRLLGWIQNKVPDLPITNFSRDWKDGRALGALVDSCAPGLCPDWESWNPVTPVENANEAMQLADVWLGIPQVIAPEEIIDPSVDEQSVMTYLSQFPKSKLKPGAPLKPKVNPKKARAYGPGLCPDWESWNPVTPVENANEAMQLADVWLGIPQVIAPEEIIDPSVDEQSVMTYLSQFPKSKLKPGAPLKPKVNPKKARAYGPGIEPSGNHVMRPAVFTVDTFSSGQAPVTVYVEDPQGRKEEVPQ